MPGCTVPGSTRPVVKIGLIAPFEGEQRPIGYQRLYGVKLALQEVNRAGGLAGYNFELVALNDFAEMTEATLQAQELVIDSDVRGVVGHWEPELAAAVAPIYEVAQLAVVKPAEFDDFSILSPTFAVDYQLLGGSPPDIQAKQAYLATYHLLEGIAAAARQFGSPERVTVRQILETLPSD